MTLALTRRAALAVFAASTATPLWGASLAPAQSNSVTLPDGRGYLLVVPPNAKAPPVLVLLHDEGQDPRQLYENTPMCDAALLAGYALLLPLGRARAVGGYGWQDGICCLAAPSDVDFIDTVVSDAEARFGVNGEILRLVGEGSGGNLALAYAAERPNGVRGVAALNATFNPEGQPVRGFVPVLLIQEAAEGILPLFARYAPYPLIAWEGQYIDREGRTPLRHLASAQSWMHSEDIIAFFADFAP